MEPSPDVKVPAPGEVLDGKYVVERVIAAGGMGVVLAARHARLGHRVAVKVLHPYARSMPQVAGRFEREARAAAQIRSPNVARVIDVDALPDGSPFMVMELLEGHDLSAELEQRGTLPPTEAVGYALEACAGMAEAHRLGIVHRDLKPSNLFLAVEGGHRVLKVLDFGISKLTAEGDVRMTATNSVLGTPLYMSPEQVRSAKNVDVRTDIWSLGVILYEMLSGDVPFTGESATAVAASIVADDVVPLAQRRSGLPPGLADVVMKALRKKPESRFQDIAELVAALQPFTRSERARGPSTLILVGEAAAAEVSADARTIDEGVADDGHVATTHQDEDDGPAPSPSPPVEKSKPPPAAEASQPPPPHGGRPAGVVGTEPGWTGAAPAPARTGPRRALLAGVAVVGVLALVGTAWSLRSPETHAPPPVGAASGQASAPQPAPAASSVPTVQSAEPSAEPSASAPAPVASPAPVPVSSAAVKKSTSPHASPAPTAAPSAAPRSPAPVGLPSHI